MTRTTPSTTARHDTRHGKAMTMDALEEHTETAVDEDLLHPFWD